MTRRWQVRCSPGYGQHGGISPPWGCKLLPLAKWCDLRAPHRRIEPILYLLAHEEGYLLRQWGSVKAFAEVVRSLRQEGERAGVGNPYLAVMHFSPQRAEKIRSSLGADAISAYAFPGGSERGASFAVIAYAWNEFDEGGWLCPTRSADGQPDTRRIGAIGQLLRSYSPPGGERCVVGHR